MAKQTAKKSHVRVFVTSVVSPRNHTKSRRRFEVFMISPNHFVGDRSKKTYNVQSNSRPFRSLELFIPGTSYVIPVAISSPEGFFAIFGDLFDRVPVRILTSDFTIELYETKCTRSEIMILECSFPWKKNSLASAQHAFLHA